MPEQGYRHPDCTSPLHAAGGQCRRRDGRLLTSPNHGDCWATARAAASKPVPGRCTCGDPLGCWEHGPQPRERAVPCRWCRQPTLNVNGCCDLHNLADDDRIDNAAEVA
jgi:hypothetical protein